VVSEVYRWYTLEARFCKLLDNGNTLLVQVWVWEEFARVAPRANSKFMRTSDVQNRSFGWISDSYTPQLPMTSAARDVELSKWWTSSHSVGAAEAIRRRSAREDIQFQQKQIKLSSIGTTRPLTPPHRHADAVTYYSMCKSFGQSSRGLISAKISCLANELCIGLICRAHATLQKWKSCPCLEFWPYFFVSKKNLDLSRTSAHIWVGVKFIPAEAGIMIIRSIIRS
jgi:hypothetical protein